MDLIDREMLFNRVRAWILEAGAIIRDKINDPLKVQTKSGPKDLVTQIDKEVEFFFATKIKRFYPNHLLLSEEGFGDQTFNTEDTIWIIDPIDGTMNFVHQKEHFAISLAIYHKGIGEIGCIFDVMENNLYSALKNNGAYKNNVKLASIDQNVVLEESMISFSHRWLTENRFIDEKVMQELVRKVRGVRSHGSAALNFGRVAEGAIDAYITVHLEPWDIAAGKIIIEEVGGITTDLYGDHIGALERSSVITARPMVHKHIMENYMSRALKISKEVKG